MDFIGPTSSVKLIADVITVEKDDEGHIGIAIGGGAPLCPCLYVVQVFDESPVAKDGRIQAGDELVSVNGLSVKGLEKQRVAKLISKTPGELFSNFLLFLKDRLKSHLINSKSIQNKVNLLIYY